jgi:McrBC 5-methylcytosine restriction system component
MELRHDDFTVDIPENQILLAAITRMLTVPRLDPLSRQRLTALRVRLADVTSLVHGAQLPEWQAIRLNGRYHTALRLAEIVWQATSPEHAPGARSGAGALYVGPGWDAALMALALFLRGEVSDPVAAVNSLQGQEFSQQSGYAWATVVESAGTASTDEIAAATPRVAGTVRARSGHHPESKQERLTDIPLGTRLSDSGLLLGWSVRMGQFDADLPADPQCHGAGWFHGEAGCGDPL